MTTNRTSSIRSWAIGVIISALTLAGLLWLFVGPVIPERKLRSLTGASKEQVTRILGEPSEIMNGRTWIYDRWLNQGWVAISFDEHGRVREINDESVF